MNKIFLLGIIFYSSLALAESITVHPFSLEFSTTRDRLDVIPRLTLTCRYERIVISDSAEYIYKTQDVPLRIVKENHQGDSHFSLALEKRASLRLDGVFRPTKECTAELTISFVDRIYAVGWGGQMSRPINFTLSSGAYRYQSGDSELDLSAIDDLLSGRKIDFYFRAVPGLQVNIWITADGVHLPLPPTSSAIDDRTGLPYLLRE